MFWDAISSWFMSIGESYGVNPFVFGAIYVGAIPFFTISIGWVVRNYRRGLPILVPILVASFFFVSAYLYLAIAGHSIPIWVYIILAAMIFFAAVSTVRNVRRQMLADGPAGEP